MKRLVLIALMMSGCATYKPYGECFADGGTPAGRWYPGAVECLK